MWLRCLALVGGGCARTGLARSGGPCVRASPSAAAASTSSVACRFAESPAEPGRLAGALRDMARCCPWPCPGRTASTVRRLRARFSAARSTPTTSAPSRVSAAGPMPTPPPISSLRSCMRTWAPILSAASSAASVSGPACVDGAAAAQPPALEHRTLVALRGRLDAGRMMLPASHERVPQWPRPPRRSRRGPRPRQVAEAARLPCRAWRPTPSAHDLQQLVVRIRSYGWIEGQPLGGGAHRRQVCSEPRLHRHIVHHSQLRGRYRGLVPARHDDRVPRQPATQRHLQQHVA
mmetsp:Transcript_17931/g.63286  ORF Transcript_17931/g.63286 Transcript_17931/m.63286 type:complete len:291 (-) Transcript_17931:1121-1993(-)